MHRVIDQNERLVRRVRPVARQGTVRARPTPGVNLTVHKCKPRIGDVEPAVLVDPVEIRRRRDVERLAADDAEVLERQQAGYKRQLVLGDAAACLEVAVFCTVLVRPAAVVSSIEAIQLVSGLVVRGVALVQRLIAGFHPLGDNEIDEVEERDGEIGDLVTISSCRDEFFGRGGQI